MVVAFLWLSAPTWTSLAWGLPVSLIGLALRAWAAGHLEKNRTLAESGPYAYMRNPLYVGTLAVAAGFVIASRRWELGLLFAAVFLLIYLPVVELEEQHLRSLFPEYADYAKRVPRLWPRLTGHSSTHFRVEVYIRNQEYQALAGFLIGVAVLIWKAL
jgi:protein-S-isoprenylcysteine O-methyltransferase Ste14